MATKVVINNYIDSLLGESGTEVSDSTIIAGMEDVIRKLEQYNYESLKDLETITEITSSPVSMHYIPPTLDVYCNDERCVKRENKQHVSNRYSLLNDYGNTTYYYVTGNNLYLYPFDESKTYNYRGIVWAVSGGRLTWADRYNYPLAMYCAMSELFKRLSAELEALLSDSSTFSTSSSPTNVGTGVNLSNLYSRVLARLNAHDVELSSAELNVIQTEIQAYSAQMGRDSIWTQRLQGRVGAAQMLAQRYQAIKQSYLEYFANMAKAE